MTTKKKCHLNCLICHLSGVRCFLRLPRRGKCGTKSQGTPCPSGDNDDSELFVGSSLQIVLTLLRHSLSQQCARSFVSDLPHRIPLSHSASPLWSLLPDDSPRCSDANSMNRMVSVSGTQFLRVTSVTRCPERCDATRSTCVSHDTKSRISGVVRVWQRFCSVHFPPLLCQASWPSLTPPPP